MALLLLMGSAAICHSLQYRGLRKNVAALPTLRKVYLVYTGAFFYSGRSRIVALLAAWAPITSTCAMSAVFEGPLIKTP